MQLDGSSRFEVVEDWLAHIGGNCVHYAFLFILDKRLVLH